MTITSNTISLQKTLFIFRQKIIFIYLPSFLKYYKDITNLLLWEFGHVYQKQHKFVRNWRLSARKKSTWSFNFSGILHFKESWNLIGQKQFGKQLQKKKFAGHEVCNGKTRITRNLILHCCLEKQMEKKLKKRNTLFWGSFFPNLGKNKFSTSCKKSEKYGANSENRQTNGWTKLYGHLVKYIKSMKSNTNLWIIYNWTNKSCPTFSLHKTYTTEAVTPGRDIMLVMCAYHAPKQHWRGTIKDCIQLFFRICFCHFISVRKT